MGGMDITENRLPQDGRSSINYSNRLIDLRLASIPTVFGENITIRILDRDESVFDIKKSGMSEEEVPKYLKMISVPHGAVVITGPTGSGKTTTLYASLNQISSVEKKIFTIVEVRDIETARIAVEAAITGHLVLTTLHTNDAPSSLTRLLEMGVESYMISSAITGIVAQRLVRILCDNCKKKIDLPDSSFNEEIRHILKGKKIFQAVGCKRCNSSGYLGRTGIFSMLVVSKRIREMLLNRKSTDEISDAAREEGMKTLLESGAYKVAEGITSLEELYRVVY